MRMWMVDPKIMCRKHILGEHVELHMFVGTINKGIKLGGYFRNDLLEPQSIVNRHSELVEEMERRGYKHNSPLPNFDISNIEKNVINKERSKTLLLERCQLCKELNV